MQRLKQNKFLVFFLLACVLVTGGLAALAVIPHTHGHDLDHSEHKNCAVYQYSQAHVDAETLALVFIFSLCAFVFIILEKSSFVASTLTLHFYLRAPPRNA